MPCAPLTILMETRFTSWRLSSISRGNADFEADNRLPDWELWWYKMPAVAPKNAVEK